MSDTPIIGTIHVTDLQLSAIIGTYPHERLAPQPLFLSLELKIDAAGACRSDELDGTLDYEALCSQMRRHAAASRWLLIERLAADLMQVIMSNPRLLACRLRLTKPGAIPQAAAIAFELAEERPQEE